MGKHDGWTEAKWLKLYANRDEQCHQYGCPNLARWGAYNATSGRFGCKLCEAHKEEKDVQDEKERQENEQDCAKGE